VVARRPPVYSPGHGSPGHAGAAPGRPFPGTARGARDFVARELRGLDGGDSRSARLRETLRAYFASGQNASAAAALLGVHEHTVSYRLRTIEDRLGRPVTARRAELETALRLLELNG
jgi:DNA-binding PucR family transcriptional regulator